MKFLDRLLGRKAKELTYDQVAELIDARLGKNVAGTLVTDQAALQVATVLACVKVIADGCATPELHVYRDDVGKREKALKRPEYRLLNRRPNAWQTSFEFRRTLTVHAALTGDGLAIKVRDLRGRVMELIPVLPGQWDVRRDGRYNPRYRCWDEFGMIGEFGPEDVFHLPNLQWDYQRGLNAVGLASSAIGLAMASERTQRQMHENAVRPSGIYSVSGKLSPEQYERLLGYVKDNHAGAANAGKPFVLDNDAKFTPTSMTGVDAQHIETRRLQVEEICRAYGVFPIMVGHADKTATFASSEAFFAAHLKHTLKPWHTAWTQRIDEMLLDGDGPLYAEFDTRYLTAGSMADRAQWARSMGELGIYTRNELRDEEGMDALPGLDEPLTPMNMTKTPKGSNDDQGNDPAPAA